MFIVLFSALVAVASASYRCGDNGNWYFCNLKLNEIHIVMTHNSLSFKRGIAKNQSRNLVSQFRDGVRGFNFDLYPCPQLGYPNPNCDVIWTQHGGLFQDYDPTKEIKALVAELQKSEYRDEVIVVQLQNGLDGNRIESREIDYLTGLFGELLIQKEKEYLDNANLRDAIEADQRVYLTTNEEADDKKYFFRSADVIGENHWKWKKCNRLIKRVRKEMPLTCRTGPTTKCKKNWEGKPILLMNSMCGVPDYTNKKCRLLKNAKRMSSSSIFDDSRYPNILMVDFYHKGEVFEAQRCLRAGNVGGNGCETCDKME